ncbi:MAG: excinuclease ABC subunit UvrB [Firmicutes bacterium]|nr:excinuclease ABC subunit UvrB [Bacillota bacterium]
MSKFELVSKFKPSGDQPQAIKKLVDGLNDGLTSQVLLGVTGSGKTFTIANVIKEVNRPTLVLAHNKTLAAQLCSELKEFFPNNAVEYFVSYYNYFQPESYIVATDTYIEKDMEINEEIDKLRHSATCSLMERRDVIVVSSVSCIYGLGGPEEYHNQMLSLRPGQKISRDELIKKLISTQYKRSDDFVRSTFSVKGDTVEIFPANSFDKGIRVEFFGNEIETISEVHPLTKIKLANLTHAMIMPASHFIQDQQKIPQVIEEIRKDLEVRVKELNDAGKPLEAYRLTQRTHYDMETLAEMGYINGIENYSRYFDGRKEGEPPFTLLDYFPKDFVMVIDESHMTLPQVRGMYNGDRARKENLVEFGFRLPAAKDNRPLKFEEFKKRLNQTIYVSATPADYELELVGGDVAEQLIRPTGLIDPEVEVRKTKGQIENLHEEILKVVKDGGRVLVTTLTKKMAENLSDYFLEKKVKTKWLHSEVKTLERTEILNGLRRGDFDVLIGINLLREGLDLPEVKLVAILDADKEGFLRSTSSLIQIIGRAARNAESRVIMYADKTTRSMADAIGETERRRKIQQEHNKKMGIVPKTIVKSVPIETLKITDKEAAISNLSTKELKAQIVFLETLMHEASKALDFEKAIEIREELNKLKAFKK